MEHVFVMFLEISVTPELPTRLDRTLRRLYPLLTQGQIEQALRKGYIKVNGQKVTAGVRVVKGDKISIAERLNLTPHSRSDRQFSASVISLAGKLLAEYLLYDHTSFMAINKPAGVATQGGSKVSLSIDDALQYLNQTEGRELRLVHRLDKDTSGILLIAKSYEASIKLTSAFKDKIIEKTYLAIVEGAPPQEQGEIASFISAKGEEEDSKFAVTRYRVVDINKNSTRHREEDESPTRRSSLSDFQSLSGLPRIASLARNNGYVPASSLSLLEFTPLTGRMHQLRIHAKELGCPIVGDKKYGSGLGEKLLLHALRIRVSSEIFGKEATIEAPVPEYFFQKVL